MIFKIQLKTIEDIKDFCNICCKQDFEIDVMEGRYIIDAKSIMGLFSLNISKILNIKVHEDNKYKLDTFIMNCKKWIVD